jgi:hypothetical protein
VQRPFTSCKEGGPCVHTAAHRGPCRKGCLDDRGDAAVGIAVAGRCWCPPAGPERTSRGGRRAPCDQRAMTRGMARPGGCKATLHGRLWPQRDWAAGPGPVFSWALVGRGQAVPRACSSGPPLHIRPGTRVMSTPYGCHAGRACSVSRASGSAVTPRGEGILHTAAAVDTDPSCSAPCSLAMNVQWRCAHPGLAVTCRRSLAP